jgi:hypothetical protein
LFDSANSANSGMKSLFLIAFILNQIVFSGGMKYMMTLIRALQLILHLPMLRIVIPANVATMISIIMPIVMFDILEND